MSKQLTLDALFDNAIAQAATPAKAAPKLAPVVPIKAAGGRVPVKGIEILWSESGLYEKTTFRTWAEANAAIREIAVGKNPGSGYDKTKYLVTWQDGETWEGRCDVTWDMQFDTAPLSEWLQSFAAHIAGREKARHQSAEEYQQFLVMNEKNNPGMAAGCARILDKYDVGPKSVKDSGAHQKAEAAEKARLAEHERSQALARAIKQAERDASTTGKAFVVYSYPGGFATYSVGYRPPSDVYKTVHTVGPKAVPKVVTPPIYTPEGALESVKRTSPAVYQKAVSMASRKAEQTKKPHGIYLRADGSLNVWPDGFKVPAATVKIEVIGPAAPGYPVAHRASAAENILEAMDETKEATKVCKPSTSGQPVRVTVKRKVSKVHGKTYGGETLDVNVEVVPGAWIHIWGEDKGYRKSAYDKVFKVGDMASYGSYNLVYYGPIISITTQTVTIAERIGSKKTHRLDLATFIDRNSHFDLDEAAKRNSEWSD